MFKSFRILLDSGCIITIVMGMLIKIITKEYYVMQWHMQVGNIKTNLKVYKDFT